MIEPEVWSPVLAGSLLIIVIAFLGHASFLKVRRKLCCSLGLLNDAFESSLSGTVLFDTRGRYYKHNSQAGKFLPILGCDERRPRTLKDLLVYMQDHGIELDDSARNVLDKSLSFKEFSAGFNEIIGWGQGSLCLVQVQSTKRSGAVVTLTDISHSRQREEMLKQMVAAIEATNSGILVSDPKKPGNPVIFVNNHFADLAGLPKAEIIGNDWRFIMDALGHFQLFEKLSASMRSEKPADLELQFVRNGSYSWYSFQVSPVYASDGRLDLFIGILADVTLRKRREAELVQAQRLESLGQLAGGVAHDFNNILSIIDGYSRMTMLALKEARPENCGDYLARIRDAVQRGAGITRQLLTFGRQKVVTELVLDIGILVRDQSALLRPLIDAGVELEICCPEKNIYVECAPDAIGNILMNLVVNAKDAMPSGGTVTVKVERLEGENLPPVIPENRRDKAYARLSVEDTGEGIPQEIIGKIFEPFFTTKPPGKGTGLGLSMVYGLVGEMGGFIDVNSVAGKGTTISVYLPETGKKNRKQVLGDPIDISKLSFNGYTVLIVEDEADLLVLEADLLERQGIKVLKASNGNEALMVQDEYEGDIDILLTDVVMPELDGIRLAELFNSLRPDTRVIFMSGYPSGGHIAKFDLPANACLLAKPVDESVLLKKIHQLVNASSH